MTKSVEAVHGAFGMRVRLVRETLGLDQAEIAKRVGLTRASIANIETGRQRILLHSVEKFATALGTTPKQLLRGIWW